MAKNKKIPRPLLGVYVMPHGMMVRIIAVPDGIAIVEALHHSKRNGRPERWAVMHVSVTRWRKYGGLLPGETRRTV